MHTPWKKDWKVFPTVLTYYEISFPLTDNFQRSFNPKIGLYVAVLLTYLYRSEQYKDPTVLPFQTLCKIRLKLTVMIMGRELFRSGGFWAWKFWLDLIVHTPMWVKHPPLSVGQGSLSLHLCYRALVNLPFCSTNQGSISTPTLLKSTFSSTDVPEGKLSFGTFRKFSTCCQASWGVTTSFPRGKDGLPETTGFIQWAQILSQPDAVTTMG